MNASLLLSPNHQMKRLCAPQPSLPPPAVFQCENWTCKQVLEWLKGVDDGINPACLKAFADLNIDGRKLVNIEADKLRQIGINKESTRVKIVSFINLLIHYSYNIKYENLQKVALQTSLSANELLNAVSYATPVIKNSQNVSKHIDVLNGVLRAVADIYESVVRLIFWLERKPFVGNSKFNKLRTNLSSYVDEMIDCVNNPNNPKFFSVPQVLVERAQSVRKICDQIIFMDDPCVLYTAFLERVTLRKTAGADWGFEIGRTCLGMNLIIRVDYSNAAAISDKFDVGDEILEIDGVPVVGWKYSNLVRRLNNILTIPARRHQSSSEMQLLLCKRPRNRDAWKETPFKSSKILPENARPGSRTDGKHKHFAKIAEDFKNKIGTDCNARTLIRPADTLLPAADHTTLRRARSSSFTVSGTYSARKCSECSLLPQASRCISLFVSSAGEKRQLFRRASVWNESPPAALRSPFEGIQSETNSWLLLLASWGGSRSRGTTERPLDFTPRKPPPLKTTFENGVSILVEEDFCEGIQEEDSDELAFSSIDLVPDNELESLELAKSTIAEVDWNAPIQEITGLRVQKRPNLDSAGPIIDSPLSNIHAKIARFFHGDVASPSPSAITTPAEHTFPSTRLTRSETQECKTPVTPNSKFSLELAPRSTKALGEEGSSSICSVDSPSTSSLVVKTIASRRQHLAPLAEPDEVGDLTFAYSPSSIDKSKEQRNEDRLDLSPQINCDFAGWIRFVTTKPSIRRKRWIKCRALIRENLLYVFENGESNNEASFVVNLALCTMSKHRMKTSRKHTFAIKSDDKIKVQFATNSAQELRTWLDRISPHVSAGIDKSSTSGSSANIESAVYFRENACANLAGNKSSTSPPNSASPFGSVRGLISRVSFRNSIFHPKTILNQE